MNSNKIARVIYTESEPIKTKTKAVSATTTAATVATGSGG